MNKYKILTINPGSTSTKVGVFGNMKPIFIKTITHSSDELSKFDNIPDQYEFRKNAVLQELINANISLEEIDAIVARGGLIKPISSGIYEVNERMREDLITGVMGQHASNLGGLIASELVIGQKAKAYIADPVVVDELEPVARITGHPDFKRDSVFHALNQKAIARSYANSNGVKYEDINLIVAHMGGGISIGAHKKGRVIDVNNALDGEGPLSPERTGTLPMGKLIKAIAKSNLSAEEITNNFIGKGGLTAYFGTNQVYQLEKQVEAGDKYCGLILNAMAYQVGKTIGAMAAVLKGNVRAILLTGGIANSEMICAYIKDMVAFLAPVITYPGEDELVALAFNGLMALRGQQEVKIYE